MCFLWSFSAHSWVVKKRERGSEGVCLLREETPVVPLSPFQGSMDILEKEGAAQGLTPTEVVEALKLGRPANEVNWIESRELGREALRMAVDSFESGRYLEYECYDNGGQPPGRGVIVLQRWADQSQGLLKASHDVASDPY